MSKQNIIKDGTEEFFQILRKDKRAWGKFYLKDYVNVWKDFFDAYFEIMALSDDEIEDRLMNYERPFLESLRMYLKPSSKRLIKGRLAKRLSGLLKGEKPDFTIFFFCGLAKKGLVEMRIDGKRTIGVDVCWYWKESKFKDMNENIIEIITSTVQG